MNAPILMSYENAVTDLVAKCKESGDPPSVEVTGVVDTLSPEGFRDAARVGLIHGAGDALHHGRAHPGGKPHAQSRGSWTDDGRNSRAHRDYLTVLLMGADGKLKELMDFTVDDCELLRLDATQMKKAWGAREKWASTAHELIKKSRKAKVRDLGKVGVAELRQLAEEAWS